MKSNLRMKALLERLKIDFSGSSENDEDVYPDIERIDGCVFLAKEFAHAHGATLERFGDRTGLECFVNHVHFQTGRGKHSLEDVFHYVSTLRLLLTSLEEGEFEIIVSVTDDNSTVRFHKWRSGETWLADNLEGYKNEAILSETVP